MGAPGPPLHQDLEHCVSLPTGVDAESLSLPSLSDHLLLIQERRWQRARASHKASLVQSEREGRENNSRETERGPVVCSLLISEETDAGEAGHQGVRDGQPQSSPSRHLSLFEAVAPEGETSRRHSLAGPSFSACSTRALWGIQPSAGEEKTDIRFTLGGAQLGSVWRPSIPSTIG